MSDHGTRSSYTLGCRCVGCKKANATYQRDRRRQREAGYADIAEVMAENDRLRAENEMLRTLIAEALRE